MALRSGGKESGARLKDEGRRARQEGGDGQKRTWILSAPFPRGRPGHWRPAREKQPRRAGAILGCVVCARRGRGKGRRGSPLFTLWGRGGGCPGVGAGEEEGAAPRARRRGGQAGRRARPRPFFPTLKAARRVMSRRKFTKASRSQRCRASQPLAWLIGRAAH